MIFCSGDASSVEESQYLPVPLLLENNLEKYFSSTENIMQGPDTHKKITANSSLFVDKKFFWQLTPNPKLHKGKKCYFCGSESILGLVLECPVFSLESF